MHASPATVPVNAQNSWSSVASSQPIKQVTIAEQDKQPWRYLGYPALSTFMASDDDFFVVRKFGTVCARVILMLQDRIVILTEELEKEDNECRQLGLDNGTLRHDPRPRRQQILEELAWRLEHYNRFILDHSELKSRPDASKHQMRNLANWMYNNDRAIQDEETAFSKREGDLMTFVPMVKTPLRRFIEKFDFIRLAWCIRRKKLNESHYPEKFVSETTSYEKSARVDKAVTCTTICLGLAMLIGPLWWLQQITADQSNLAHRLEIISGFIIVFTFLMGIVTVAKPFEVLAATAAYSAVLMVFMQLSPVNSPSNPG
ncbi:hypothetical protein MMC06_003873 [Schaereria dolodes]|nr:hypothetical protein [Schaereria dolodes]